MKTICKKLWLKINLWAFKYCPPGYRADAEMSVVLMNWIVALIYSLITFGYGLINDCIRILSWKNWLKNDAPIHLKQHIEIRTDALQLIEQSKEEMIMTPFLNLISGTLIWFLLSGVLVMLMFVISHYMHYRSETKSIYVMKRLKGNKLIESYFKVPVSCFFIHMAICLGLVGAYFLIYQIAIKILL